MDKRVRIKQGLIEGEYSADGKTLIFRGVPYAQPPVGKLRFRRPQEKEPWEGVLECRKFPPKCPQAELSDMDFYGKEFYSDDHTPTDEDCLYLNIFAPSEDSAMGEKRPVMLWIHGGAFMHGCGSEKEFDGEGMARKGVILVTINYRLNAFGFFAHPELEEENEERVSGNYGILDQIFAIKWVRENIEAFGGDPERVTVFGQSAGCISVQAIISSPLAEGLVSGAILQSGGGLNSLMKNPTKETLWETSKKLMDILGVESVEELRAIPAQSLKNAAYRANGEGLSWTPHIDGWLLPDSTDKLALSGKIHDIPYMIGSTGDDIGGAKPLQESGERWCRNQLNLGRKPAYFYFFDRKLPGDSAGAFHSSELWYVFETLNRCWRPFEEHDKELSKIMSTYWANFAKCGDPNGENLPEWNPYTDENARPMIFD